MRKAVILFSGGLDSTTCLALAKQQDYACHALSFDYDQNHAYELTAARAIAKAMGVVEHRVVKLDVGQFGGSALTDKSIQVPDFKGTAGIPVTYVPARNLIFLSVALGYAEAIEASHIFIGVNAVDYSQYPDCRPAFIDAFQELIKVATKAGVEGRSIQIEAPLLQLSKAQIVELGSRLNVDYRNTVSCYRLDEEGKACGRCDSCTLRRNGFIAAGIVDPTHYVE